MPTYEYECAKCGVFEVSQRMADKALTKCPTCKRKVQRLISASSFAFKGTGWYVTDYARKGGGGSEKSGSSDSSSSDSSSTSSSSSDSSASSSSDTKSSSTPAKAKSDAKSSAGKKTKS